MIRKISRIGGSDEPHRHVRPDRRPQTGPELRPGLEGRRAVLLEHDRLHASRNDAAIETLLYAPNTGPLKKTNPDLAVAAAIEAFSRNAFMVVVGGKQMIALDDVAVISARTDVVFIKLLRLKGG
ncbi:hypothetical protein [Mesorhizobium sp.]|uniref:hypothetical protein n=1 Tax=Mesorhizobium sp. TaxID=1871066 RepID=UPI0025C50ECE|nr:hypothetical protein [Mesorhizobium sp.]